MIHIFVSADFEAVRLKTFLPVELWTDVLKMALPDPMLNGKLHAKARARLCGVSRAVRTLVHSDSAFWSSIHLDTLVYPSALKFVLGRISNTAAIRLKLSLSKLNWDMHRDPPSVIYDRLNELLSLLVPFASRWESFHLSTEHPSLFLRVRDILRDVDAPALRLLLLYYCYMPEYSIFDIPAPTCYDMPFVPGPWFRNTLLGLTRLSVLGSHVDWHAPGQFNNLVDFEIGDVETARHIKWDAFELLFEVAANLEVFRLGSICPFHLPAGSLLVSTSVTTFFFEFSHKAPTVHMTEFMSRLRFPSLRRLVARADEWADFAPVLRCSTLLPGVTAFELFGRCRDRAGLSKIFGLMPELQSLDLSRAGGYAFSAFRDCLTSLPPATPVAPSPVPPCICSSALAAQSPGPVPDSSMDAKLDDPASVSDVPVPTEIVNMILDLSAARDDSAAVDKILRARVKVTLLSKAYAAYVALHPIYWDHVLLTPRTMGGFPGAVAAAKSLPLHLTVRIMEPSPPARVDWVQYYTQASEFVAAASTAVLPHLDRCAGLAVEGVSQSRIETFLHNIRDAELPDLRYISVTFRLMSLSNFFDTSISFGAFKKNPVFGPVFKLYRVFSILPTTDIVSRCTHFSDGTTSCTVYQSRTEYLRWTDILDMLDPRGYYTRVTLRDLLFVDDPTCIRSTISICSITILTLVFDGNVHMARMISCLVLPNLIAFVVHLTDCRDWECLSLCGGFLSCVPTLKLVSVPSKEPSRVPCVPSGFHRFYSLLHGVHRLDLRYASRAIFDGLIEASSTLPHGSSPFGSANWNSCPSLIHIDLGDVDLESLRQLVSARDRAGYCPLSSLSVNCFGRDREVLLDAWCLMRMIYRFTYVPV
ncbi:hypothetical protein DFH06DRAFT_1343347 [Mycena polygramma]|nr:hypothetical protein DFH06DRAFT_1343347 [Mycena polygramma]